MSYHRPGFLPGGIPDPYIVQQLQQQQQHLQQQYKRTHQHQASLHQQQHLHHASVVQQSMQHHQTQMQNAFSQFGNIPQPMSHFQGMALNLTGSNLSRSAQNARAAAQLKNVNSYVNRNQTSTSGYNIPTQTPTTSYTSPNITQNSGTTTVGHRPIFATGPQSVKTILTVDDQPDPIMQYPDVRITNIMKSTTNSLLFCIFSACGHVLKWERMKCKNSDKNWVIIKYKTAAQAARSIRVLRNYSCPKSSSKYCLEPNDDESVDMLKDLHFIYKEEWLKNQPKDSDSLESDRFFLNPEEKGKDEAAVQLIDILTKPPPDGPYPKLSLILPGTMNSNENDDDESEVCLFAGNLSSRIVDSNMFSLLAACGTIIEWKRSKTISGNRGSFGFAKYSKCEDALRAIRLLNKTELDGKNLVIKADKKSKSMIDKLLQRYKDEYVGQQRKRKRWEDSDSDNEDDDQTDDSKFLKESIKQIDTFASRSIHDLIKEMDDNLDDVPEKECPGESDDDIQEIPTNTQNRSTNNSPDIEEVVQKNEEKVQDRKARTSLLQDQIDALFFIPLVGLEFILEVREAKITKLDEAQYYCTLCNGISLLSHTVLAHVKSLPHRIKYIKKCCPALDMIFGVIEKSGWTGARVKQLTNSLLEHEKANGRTKILVCTEDEKLSHLDSTYPNLNQRVEGKLKMVQENKSGLSTSLSKVDIDDEEMPHKKAKTCPSSEEDEDDEEEEEDDLNDRPKEHYCLEVTNIPPNVHQFSMKTLFSRYGTISSMRMNVDNVIVYFKSKQNADAAIKGLNGRSFRNRKLNVQKMCSKTYGKDEKLWLCVYPMNQNSELNSIEDKFKIFGNISKTQILKNTAHGLISFEKNENVPEASRCWPEFSCGSEILYADIYQLDDVKKLLLREFQAECLDWSKEHKISKEKFCKQPKFHPNYCTQRKEFNKIKLMFTGEKKVDTKDENIKKEWRNYWSFFVKQWSKTERKKNNETVFDTYMMKNYRDIDGIMEVENDLFPNSPATDETEILSDFSEDDSAWPLENDEENNSMTGNDSDNEVDFTVDDMDMTEEASNDLNYEYDEDEESTKSSIKNDDDRDNVNKDNEIKETKEEEEVETEDKNENGLYSSNSAELEEDFKFYIDEADMVLDSDPETVEEEEEEEENKQQQKEQSNSDKDDAMTNNDLDERIICDDDDDVEWIID